MLPRCWDDACGCGSGAAADAWALLMDSPGEQRNVAGGEGSGEGAQKFQQIELRCANPRSQQPPKAALCKQPPGRRRACFYSRHDSPPPDFFFIYFFLFYFLNLNVIFSSPPCSLSPAPTKQGDLGRAALALAARCLLAAGLLGVFKPCENPGSW